MEAAGRSARGAPHHQFEGLPSLGDRAELAELFLRRLKRVLLLRFYTDTLLSPNDRHLLDQVIYSTYRDCQDLDVTLEARRLISEARGGVGLFRRPLAREHEDKSLSI